MPDPNRPRPKPPSHPGFEVVDDEPAPPKPAARPAPRPAAPPAAKAPPAVNRATPLPPGKLAPPGKPAPAAKPAPPQAARPAPKPAAKPAFEVVDDTEVEEAARSGTARKPVRAARDGDDEDDRPRKKKKKKGGRAKTAEEHAEELREQRLKEFEYTWPTVLLLLGMGLSLAGAIGSAGAGGFVSVLIILLGLLVSIPLTIVGLMVVGVVCGINYGRFGPAVVKIAAITFITNGVYFIGEWFKVPLFIIGPIAGSVSFGLFKALFDLDNQETGTSMGALNVMSFVMKVLILLLLLPAFGRGRDGDRDYDPDDDPPPFNSSPAPRVPKPTGPGQVPPPVMDTDDGDDE